jgi:hypothetical protein
VSEAAWGFAGIVVVQVVGVIIVWLNILSSKQKTEEVKLRVDAAGVKADVASAKADQAREAATEAADLSRPTANGFADDMRGGIEDLRVEVREGMMILARGMQTNSDSIAQLNGAMLRHINEHHDGRRDRHGSD